MQIIKLAKNISQMTDAELTIFMRKNCSTPAAQDIIQRNNIFSSISSYNIDEIMGDTFARYASNREMLREAGWKENLFTSLVSAVIMLMSNESVEAAAKKHKLTETQITQVYNNPRIREIAKKHKAHQYKRPQMPVSPKNVQNTGIKTTEPSADDMFNFIAKNECYRDKSGNPILNLRAYLDPSKKNMAIGVGFNLDRPMSKGLIEGMGLNYAQVRSGKQVLTENQVKQLFAYDLNLATTNARNFVNNFNSLPYNMKKVLIDMSYNMGENKLGTFQKLKKALERNDFVSAANEIKNSKWYAQTKGRGKQAVEMIASIPSKPSTENHGLAYIPSEEPEPWPKI